MIDLLLFQLKYCRGVDSLMLTGGDRKYYDRRMEELTGQLESLIEIEWTEDKGNFKGREISLELSIGGYIVIIGDQVFNIGTRDIDLAKDRCKYRLLGVLLDEVEC